MNAPVAPFKSGNKKRSLVNEKITATIFCCDAIAMAFALIVSQITAPYIKLFLYPFGYHGDIGPYAATHDMLFLFMGPFVLYLFYSKGHYTQRIPWWSQVQHLLMISFAAFVLDGAIRFSLHVSPSRLLIGMSWVYVFLFCLVARQIVYRISVGRGIWHIPTVLIGDQQTIIDTLFAFSIDHYTGYDVKVVYINGKDIKEIDTSMLPKKYSNIKIRQAIKDYKPFIDRHPDYFYIVSLESFRGDERDSLINTLEKKNTLYAFVPAVSRVNSYEMDPQYFFGSDIMLLHAKQTSFSVLGKFIKRTMDILISVTALILCAPLMLIISTLIKLEGQKGSLFYGGERIGYRRKRFKCWKFRTMEPGTDHLLDDLLKNNPEAKKEWETYRKLKNDPRVKTRMGAFMRQTSLDELPQLWNVFTGDMSLVGPRPILENEIEDYGESFFRYYRRVRPGITGLWQVSGRNETSFQRRVLWDSWYVRNWSFWGDIVILIKTLRVLLKRDGAY